MSQISLRFSGFGGQGIILSAVIIASGAVMHEGKAAVQTQSYGPESRGGATKADAILSDTEINYPLINKTDVLIALSQESLEKYINDTHENSLVIIDPLFIKKAPGSDHHIRLIEIPSAKLADELGSRLVANMIILGAVVALTSVISQEALEESIKGNTAPAFHELNISGMRVGVRYAQKLRTKEI